MPMLSSDQLQTIVWTNFDIGVNPNIVDYPAEFCQQIEPGVGGDMISLKGESGFGLMELTTESESAKFEDPDAYHPAYIEAPEFTKAFAVTLTEYENAMANGDPIVERRSQKLGTTFRNTRNWHFMNFWKSAFDVPSTAGFSGGDGVPFVSAAHPQSKTNAATWSNLVSGAPIFTDTNLETARTTYEEIEDPKGNLVNAGSDEQLIIVHGRKLKKRVWEVVMTNGVPYKADNTLNFFGPQGQGYMGLCLPQLDNFYWFLASLEQMRQYFVWRWFRRLLLNTQGDIVNRDLKVVASCRFGLGTPHCRWFVGSNATA